MTNVAIFAASRSHSIRRVLITAAWQGTEALGPIPLRLTRVLVNARGQRFIDCLACVLGGRGRHCAVRRADLGDRLDRDPGRDEPETYDAVPIGSAFP